MKQLTYKDISATITQKEHSEMEISVSVPVELFKNYKAPALAELGQDLALPGFRKGHIPEKMLIDKLGEDRLLAEMAEFATRDAYLAIIIEHKLDPIGEPRVTISKMGMAVPLEMIIAVAVVPKVALPDYKAIAKKIFSEKEEPADAEESEIERALADLRKRKAQMDMKRLEIKDEELPALDDAFAKSRGEFENLAALKAHLKEEIVLEKKRRARDKARLLALEEIVKGTNIDLPNVLIEGELDRMQSEFEHTLGRSGAKFDDYLAQTKKSREEIRNSWRSDAEKRVKGQFVLSEISRTEQILPPQEQVEHEIELMKEHYRGADPARLRGYVEMMLGNDAVFSFLEGQSGTK